MKPHTRDILDVCTELLAEFGLKKKRRGLATQTLSSEMIGAIALQHREFPDGTVGIDTCPQVYWEPIQRIYSFGIGEKYRAVQTPTRSRMWSFINLGEPDLVFVPNAQHAAQLMTLRSLVRKHVLPKVADLANETSVTAFYHEQIPFGGHRPEMYLSIRAWQTRSTKLDDEFDQICSRLNHQEFIDGVTKFYDRLRCSQEVAALIG